MIPAIDIAASPARSNRIDIASPNSISVSTSPNATFHSPPMSFKNHERNLTGAYPKPLKPFDSNAVKILLLENVNETGIDILKSKGYQVECLKTSLPEEQLIEKIRYSIPHNESDLRRCLLFKSSEARGNSEMRLTSC
jgi:D-3-phosphoglycerate dehydrogenase